MINRKVVISNKLGLHARAAAKLVALSSRFESCVELEKNNQKINGKSIMGVMMLAASHGSEILLKIEGVDEQEAEKKIVSLIDSRFGEEE